MDNLKKEINIITPLDKDYKTINKEVHKIIANLHKDPIISYNAISIVKLAMEKALKIEGMVKLIDKNGKVIFDGI